MNLALNAFEVIAAAAAALVFFICKYYRRRTVYPLFFWFLWMFLSTVLNQTDYYETLKQIAKLIGPTVLGIYLFDHDRDKVVRNLAVFYTILMAGQAFSMATHLLGKVIMANRYLNNYLFGIRVQINKYAPFALFFSALNCRYGKKPSAWPLWISTACGLYFSVMERVSTSLTGYAIILAVLILSRVIKRERTWRNLAVFTLLAAIAFAFLYAGSGSIFRWFFEDVLGESLTLSERTVIWAQAFSYMKGIHWLIGNGHGHEYYFRLSRYWVSQLVHNQYLETIFEYGFVGMGLYVWMLVRQLRVNEIKRNNYFTRVFLAVFIAVLFIQIPASVYEKPHYYLFYIASLYLPAISCSELARGDGYRRLRLKL